MKTIKLFTIFIFTIVIVSCSTPPEITLPAMSGYRTMQPNEIQGWIDKALSISTNDPEIDTTLKTLKFVNGVTKCYQDKGAVQIGFYTKENDLLTAGVVTIIDHNQITDFKTLAVCAVDGLTAKQNNMCFFAETLERGDNKFYIAYMGTNQEICGKFSDWYSGLKSGK